MAAGPAHRRLSWPACCCLSLFIPLLRRARRPGHSQRAFLPHQGRPSAEWASRSPPVCLLGLACPLLDRSVCAVGPLHCVLIAGGRHRLRRRCWAGSKISAGLSVRVRAGLQLAIGACGHGRAGLDPWSRATGGFRWVPWPSPRYINVANFMDGVNGISGLHGMAVGVLYAVAGHAQRPRLAHRGRCRDGCCLCRLPALEPGPGLGVHGRRRQLPAGGLRSPALPWPPSWPGSTWNTCSSRS